MRQEVFIKSEVSRITKLPQRSVQFYTERGVVVPDVYQGRRRGDHHQFSVRNLFEFAVIREFRVFGIGIGIIKIIIDDFVHGLDDAGLKAVDYGERLLGLKPHVLIYESDNDGLVVQVKFVNRGNKREMSVPVVSIQELKDHVAILAIDLVALFKKILNRI